MAYQQITQFRNYDKNKFLQLYKITSINLKLKDKNSRWRIKNRNFVQIMIQISFYSFLNIEFELFKGNSREDGGSKM